MKVPSKVEFQQPTTSAQGGGDREKSSSRHCRDNWAMIKVHVVVEIAEGVMAIRTEIVTSYV